MAEILCLATVLPQQGKLSFGYQDLISGPQKDLRCPKGHEIKNYTKTVRKAFRSATMRKNKLLSFYKSNTRFAEFKKIKKLVDPL